MSFRLLRSALAKRKGRVALGVLSVAIGAALATSLLGLLSVSEDRMARELKGYGANILVTPDGEGGLEVGGVSLGPKGDDSLLNEQELPRLKTIFWKNNILGIAPFLSLVARVKGEPLIVTGTWFDHSIPLPEGGNWQTGVSTLFPNWRIDGDNITDGDSSGALVGASLAQRLALNPGDRLAISYQGRSRQLQVRGILNSGGLEENQVLVNLPVAQELAGLERGIDRALVSALTIPREKAPADIRDKNPGEMTPDEYLKWYCTPLIDSVIVQISEVTPGGSARAIRQVSEAESNFLARSELLVVLMTMIALVVSALVVLTVMTAIVLERRTEIGLMKAIGADNSQIAFLFALEAVSIGVAGGIGGYLAGSAIGYFVGPQLFGASLPFMPSLLPLSLGIALGISFLGSALPIWQAIKVPPMILLREAT